MFHGCDLHSLWIERSDFEVLFIEDSRFTDLIIDMDGMDATMLLFKTTVQDGYMELDGNRIRIEKSTFILKGGEEILNQVMQDMVNREERLYWKLIKG